MIPSHIQHLLCALSLLSLCAGCGSEGDGGALGSGVATAEWDGFCIATFTQDTAVRDSFDEPLFTARVGERYLIRDYNDFGTELKAELYYLTSGAPIDFDVSASEGSFPFEASCAPGEGVHHNTVFTSLTVYRDAELTDPLCELPSATHALGSSAAYLASGALTEIVTYRVGLAGLSGQCGDAEEGYVSSRAVMAFGSRNFSSPIGLALWPAE